MFTNVPIAHCIEQLQTCQGVPWVVLRALWNRASSVAFSTPKALCTLAQGS